MPSFIGVARDRRIEISSGYGYLLIVRAFSFPARYLRENIPERRVVLLRRG